MERQASFWKSVLREGQANRRNELLRLPVLIKSMLLVSWL